MKVDDLLKKLKDSPYPDSDIYVSLSDGQKDSPVIDIVFTDVKCVIFARRENG